LHAFHIEDSEPETGFLWHENRYKRCKPPQNSLVKFGHFSARSRIKALAPGQRAALIAKIAKRLYEHQFTILPRSIASSYASVTALFAWLLEAS
jgi:hypothetical protein